MSEIAQTEPLDRLQILLDEQGINLPAGTTASSNELSLDVDVSRAYGIQATLPDGGVGRLIVRQVHQQPDRYIADLPIDDEHRRRFEDSKLSGLLVDAQIQSTGYGHLYAARRAVVSLSSKSGNQAAMSTFKQFQAGRVRTPTNLLALDTTNLEVSRPLMPAEMYYSEPSIPAMILSALRNR